MSEICIAVDAMGGEHSPESLVDGIRLLEDSLPAKFLLVGDENRVRECDLKGLNVELVHAEQVVDMNESPATALKRKRQSSIAVAIDLVKRKKAQAFFSAGNTGVAMAFAFFELGRLEGVLRPALGTIIPSIKGPVLVADVGANVDCKPHWLAQFALMGHAYMETVVQEKEPKVGLLSIGEEPEKGNEQTLQAYKILQQLPIPFIGNIEGNDIPLGTASVVVTDGFVGNVLLKFGEGLAEMILGTLKDEITKLKTMVGASGESGKDRLSGFFRQMDYAEYGAALLLGVNGNCLIGHGKSSPKAVASALKQAYRSVHYVMNEKIVEEIKRCQEIIPATPQA